MMERPSEKALSVVSYDRETGIFIWVRCGRPEMNGTRAGFKASRGYRRIRIDGVNYAEHRIAWLIGTGRWPAEQIDHINGIRSDNRLCNLREATNAQNNANKPGRGPWPKGVCWNPTRHKFQAEIKANGRRRYLGRYDTPEQAAEAYRRAALRLHGDFANLASEAAA